MSSGILQDPQQLLLDLLLDPGSAPGSPPGSDPGSASRSAPGSDILSGRCGCRRISLVVSSRSQKKSESVQEEGRGTGSNRLSTPLGRRDSRVSAQSAPLAANLLRPPAEPPQTLDTSGREAGSYISWSWRRSDRLPQLTVRLTPHTS